MNEVHGDYYPADIISRGVAYHIGYLPSAIRMRIEELYRKGLIHTIFSTSTLVEGVNLPADNLFITHYKNGRPEMNVVDFKNLVGRVGRIEYNLFGNVFLVRLVESVMYAVNRITLFLHPIHGNITSLCLMEVSP